MKYYNKFYYNVRLLAVDKNSSWRLHGFKYEHLDIFCYMCGVIDHTINTVRNYSWSRLIICPWVFFFKAEVHWNGGGTRGCAWFKQTKPNIVDDGKTVSIFIPVTEGVDSWRANFENNFMWKLLFKDLNSTDLN